MDWLKLFALLVAVACMVSAEGPKKKIRIHLPQKVKHIHHHKKIYITNHAAPSQYAPGYMPSAEAAMAPGVAVPPVGGLLPVHSVEVYDEAAPARLPALTAAGSKILPLYRARGYYGPNPSEWEDPDYDLAPPSEPLDHSYVPSAFSGPSAPAAPANFPHKKVKVIKVNDQPRKKVPRKGKPKRVPARPKPQLEEEIPVSSYHEHFYSDLDGSATIRKVKKPHRIEKIIDGDNEHIHTYSEEHIHKLVYDDGTSKLVGVDPVGSMSALSASHPIYPVKNSLVAFSPETLTAFATMGSMGTPSHLEFAAYNPRDVTHDHVFHDHGEIPPDTDITKESLPYPPRVSYNNQGVRIGGLGYKGTKSKFPISPYPKPTRPTAAVNEYSYYESMYSPYSRPRTVAKPTSPSSLFPASSDSIVEDYRNIPSFKLREKGNVKPRNVIPALYFGNGKQTPDPYRTQQTSAPAPFAVSSTIVHDYKPKNFAGSTTGTIGFKHRDPLQNFKDSSYTNNFELDSYASASNVFSSGDKYADLGFNYQNKRGKKKSVSTQNIRIGGLDHQTTVDHMGDAGMSMSMNDAVPSALDFDPTKGVDSATSTPYTIRESSLAYPYYSAMAAKALHGEEMQIGEASNDNYQYVEAPTPATTESVPVATTNIPPSTEYQEIQNTDVVPTDATELYVYETRQKHRVKDTKVNALSALKDTRQRYPDLEDDNYGSVERPAASSLHQGSRHSRHHSTESPGATGSRKYGDKI